MKNNFRVALVALVCVVIAGLFGYNHRYCRYGYPFVKTSSGLSYKFMRSGNGRKVQAGEWIQFRIMVKAIDGDKQKDRDEEKDQAISKDSDKGAAQARVLFSSEETGPLLLPFDTLQKNQKRFAEVVAMVEEKQRMVFKCAPQCLLEESIAAYIVQIFNLSKGDELEGELTIDKIMSLEEKIALEEAQRVAREAQQVAREAQRVARLEVDKQLILKYLDTHGLKAHSTEAGIYYIIEEASQDIPITKDKAVKLHYTGRLLDGKVFDTSKAVVAKANHIYDDKRPYEPLDFQLKDGSSFIPGWEASLLLLKKNEKARVFIPSTLAYGEESVGCIPANAVLCFELEILDVY